MAALCKNCGAKLKNSGKSCSKCGSSRKENKVLRKDNLSGIMLSGETKQFPLNILPGEKIFNDRFLIKSYIGSGGFGEVYLAIDTDADHPVALKIVPSMEGNENTAVEQLRNEINLRRNISNFTYITTVNDVYVDNNYKGLSLVLLSMEYASQGSLRDWVRKNNDLIKQDDKHSEGLRYFEDVCLGVKEIHNAGLMHLDLKPENILLLNGKAKVSDLGLSCNYIQYSQNRENAPRPYGTPAYMSPEQFKSARKKDISHLSDIYSLGIILFELLDGSVPFDGTYDELKIKHLTFTPPTLDESRASWGKIVNRCLIKKPSLRYGSSDELLSDLIRAKTGYFLSVDVACKCGHINNNPDLKECQKCKSDISNLFRRCPICNKFNRLDVEVCPADKLGCSYEVGRYFRIEDLLNKAIIIQDLDLLEAIKYLAEVLRLDRGNAEAKKLLPKLRNLQEKTDEIILNAEKAEKEGRLEYAREKWQDVLSLVNRHRLAVIKKKELDEQIRRFNEGYNKAFVLMSRGAFQQAYECLNECQKLIPVRRETKEAINKLNEREQRYNQHYEEAITEMRLKNLNAGRVKLEICLSVASESAEAIKLISGIHNDLQRSTKFFQLAQESILNAEFKKAKIEIENIRSIQNDYEGVDELGRELEKKEKSYNILVKDCDMALNAKTRDLNKAVISLEKALNICPKSKQLEYLLKSVLRDKERSLKLISESKSNIASASFQNAETQIQDASVIWLKVPGLEKTKNILKEVRENYEGYIKKAADFHKNEKDLQRALNYATSAFNTCKKSDEARSMVNQINRDIKKVENLLDQVASDIQSASFINAKKKFKAISDIWVNALRLEEMKKECKIKEKKYEEYYGKTLELYEEKDLESAIKSADQALKIFSSSPQLLEVHEKISNDMATATKLLKSVSSFISFTKFNEAKANINLIINMWPKFPNIEETENKVELTEKNYNKFYNAAKTLLNNKRDLISARDNIISALTLCSQSQEAKELRQQIDNTIFEKEQRNQKIKDIAIVLIQVVGVLLIGGAIVYFIVWPIMVFVWGIISWILRHIIIPIFSGIIHIFSSIFHIFSK